MNSKSIAITAFILLALAQLFVPAQMIWGREEILENGKEFRFKTQPIDPSDPMRGKYISLRFDANSFPVDNADKWKNGQEIFVQLSADIDGFAQVLNVTKKLPANASADYIKANVDYVQYGSEKQLFIKYPFERYYMDESKAYAAEQIYNRTQSDSTKQAYALVNIRDGDAVLRDVMINGVSIKDVVRAEREMK